MASRQRSTVIGVFQDRQEAQQAVNELKRAGFTEEEIGVAGRDEDNISGAHDMSDIGSKAAAGATTGLAAGAGLGALWGVGIVAGLLPAIGPAIAGGTLAAILSSAAAGAAAAGLAGALIGLGIPEDEAEYYDNEFRSGRIIITVKAGDRYDEAYSILRRHQGYDFTSAGLQQTNSDMSSASGSRATGSQQMPVGQSSQPHQASQEDAMTMQAREEELRIHKQPVQTGEVRLHKEVTAEHKVIEVPVRQEEIVIERRPVGGHESSSSDIGQGGEIRVPITEEHVHVEKQPVGKEEVQIGRRQRQDIRQVSETMREEEIQVDSEGDVDVRDQRG